MQIAKVVDAKGREIFAEVKKVASVLFDPRPGWVLLSAPLDVLPRKRDAFWMHPDDVRFVWVRTINLAPMVELADEIAFR
jgi:hypothetical protein